MAFTSVHPADSTVQLNGGDQTDATRQQAIIDWLSSESQINESLLHSLTEIYLCESPDDYVKSEVISLLMQKECRTHDTNLTFVDPKIVATQVMQIDEATGFALAPQRIKKLMRKPLVAAVDGNHETLSLRVRSHS